MAGKSPLDHMEPAAAGETWVHPHVSLQSIAISLKRIADSMELVIDEGQHGYIFPAVRVRNQS